MPLRFPLPLPCAHFSIYIADYHTWFALNFILLRRDAIIISHYTPLTDDAVTPLPSLSHLRTADSSAHIILPGYRILTPIASHHRNARELPAA